MRRIVKNRPGQVTNELFYKINNKHVKIDYEPKSIKKRRSKDQVKGTLINVLI
jgi:hypothetical protein